MPDDKQGFCSAFWMSGFIMAVIGFARPLVIRAGRVGIRHRLQSFRCQDL